MDGCFCVGRTVRSGSCIVGRVGALIALLCISGALQSANASCVISSPISTAGSAGESFIFSEAFAYHSSFYYGSFGPTVQSYDPGNPAPPPVSPAATFSFWALGSGNPTIGLGDDSGLIPNAGFSFLDLSDVPSDLTSYVGGTIDADWADPDADGCLSNAGATAGFDGDECTAVLVTDQDGSNGSFALVSAQVTEVFDSSGNATRRTSLLQPGVGPGGQNTPIVLKPIRSPEALGVSIQANQDLLAEVSVFDPDPVNLPGLYEDAACGSALVGYKVWAFINSAGAPPPSDRSTTSGWILPDLIDGSPQAITQLCSTSPCPEGSTVQIDIPCGAFDTDVYIATQWVFDSGFETPVVSANGSMQFCGAPLFDHWVCGPNSAGSNPCSANDPVCGNGVIELGSGLPSGTPTEICDDGNVVSGDGCSATCTLEEEITPAAFAAVQNLISGSADGATSVGTADLDSDGDLDVISTSGGDHTILWYRSSGTSPPFFTPFVIDQGGVLGPNSVFVSDIDGDGDPDVLTASRFDNTIAWWANDIASDSLENWTKHLVYDQHLNALQAVAGDLDGDGDMDIVSVSDQLDMIVWHENDSGWNHHVLIQDPDADPQNEFNGPMDSPFDVSLADIDNDGDLDIVAVASLSSTVEWFQNHVASGGPLAWTMHNLDGGIPDDPLGVAGVTTGDIDGDGDLDVVTAAPRQDKISFWVNPGSPANESPWSEQVVTEDPDAVESGEEGFANSVVRVVLADLDADGDEDILSANTGQPEFGTPGNAAIASYENVLGDGTEWTARTLSAAVDSPRWVHAVDLDSDGDIDALSASVNDDAVAWYQNRTIHRSAIYPVATPISSDVGVDASAFSVALGDVDRDGDLDLVAGNGLQLDSRNRLFLNNGTDDPWNGVLPFDFPVSDPTASVALGDVDRDGDLDLVVGNLASAVVPNQLYLNNGTADPWNAVSPLPITGDHDDTMALALGDVDNDGDLDLIAGNQGQANRLYLNDGSGDPWDSLGGGEAITADVDGTVSVVLGDVDGDGDLDLVVGNNLGADGQVNRLYLNNGTGDPWGGVVGSAITLDANVTNSVSLGDVDGDGDLDLVEGNAASQQGRLYLNNGTTDPWGDATGSPIRCGDSVTSQALGDVDADGDVDALAADSAVAQQIYMNNGSPAPFTGAVCRPIDGSASFGGQAAALGDVDGDGDLDVVVGSADSNEPITWYANLGGQYRFGAEDVAPTVIYDTGETAVLAIEVVLNARSGDSVGELARLELLFESAAGFPLSDSEANALIDSLSIYRDTGSGEFESGSDVLVQTFDPLILDVEGVMNVVLQEDEPNLRVAAPATFFAVATITADASSRVPATFRMTFLTDPRSSVEDASTDAPLTSEPSSDLSSSLVTVAGFTTVDSVIDATIVGDGLTSFREAVVEANANTGDDRIVLEAETYTLDLDGADEDGAMTGDLDVTDITGKLTIVGKGAGKTIIDGVGLDRVFHVLGGDLEIRDVTIRGGVANTATSLFGGAIANEAGDVTIVGSVISGNTALAGGGAIYNGGGSVDINTCTLSNNSVTDSAGSGGAILNRDSGQLSVKGSTVSGNTADNGGALSNQIDGVALLTLTTLSGNVALEGGAVFLGDGTVSLTSCSVIDNSAAITGGGLQFGAVPAPDAELQLGNTILALNSAPLGADGYDATGGSIVSAGFNLVGDDIGLNLTPANGDMIGTTVARVEPWVGPLQNNGGPTETHRLRPESPAADAGNCTEEADQRGISRVDVPGLANPSGGNGCDIGAYEIPLAELLPRVDIPIRWCVVEGAPSFDFLSPTVQADVNAVLRERHVLSSNSIFEPQAAVRFRSAANIQKPSYPILPDPDLTIGDPGDVVVEPEARNYDEFQTLIAACRAEWEARDPSIVGITVVQINKFVDPTGVDFGLLGMGGRAEFGDPVQQMVGGRVMVVDDLNRVAANPPDTVGRLLGHELGHASSLPHGDGVDNAGPYEQCGNGVLDDDDDLCEEKARFDGANLMQYRNGVAMTIAQILQIRLHTEATVPDLFTDPETSGLADLLALDDERARLLDFERARLLDFERARLLDFERARLLDFERARLLDFERARLLDFEEKEILDFGFLDVIDYGMTFGAMKTTVYASLAGLIWPTPIRPPTVYFWYLDVDESDLTGAIPIDFGYPGGLAQEEGVDVIVQVNIFSECDIDNICEDFVTQQVFDWDDIGSTGFVLADGPISGFDSVEGITVGLVQSTVGPEREDPTTGMIVRAAFPNSILENAVPGSGFALGDPVRMEVISAIACELTLPDGTIFDCQCTDCADCPDYPGCDTGIVPDAFKECTISTDLCIIDDDCVTGAGVCSGEDVLIIGDEPGGQLQFVQPVLPNCAVDPAVAEPGDTVTITAIDFSTNPGRALTVYSGEDQIGVNSSPVFDTDGTAEITATIPTDAIYGEHELTVLQEGFATAAECILILGVPPAVIELSAPADPVEMGSAVALDTAFVDNAGETHTAEWGWGDGTVSRGTVTEPIGIDPGTVSDSHVYSDPGVYTVTLTITDNNFNTTQEIFRFVVIYDPAGGFVTGAGRIESPPGAYLPDPGLVGRAKFGLVAKYNPNTTTPSGKLKFEIGGLLLEATSYDWLVIEDLKATAQGSGTIDGEGNYGFLVSLIDAKLDPAIGTDLFRIKIWDQDDANAVVYDSQSGDPDNADPIIESDGGNLTIHHN